MPRMDAMRDVLATEYADNARYASLHSDDPGTAGDNEIAATPRQAITWNAGDPGEVVASQMVFDVAAGEVVSYVGLWSHSTGGTFLESVVVAPTDFPEDGNFVIADLTYTQD